MATGKTAICGKCKASLGGAVSDGHPLTLTDADFRQQISSGRTVVDFWAAWCGPCRAIAPVIEQLAAARKDIQFAKLNVDENPSTSAQFGVQSIPLLIFFERGVERGRLVGAHPRASIEAAIGKHFG